jgi:hypothetical protein
MNWSRRRMLKAGLGTLSGVAALPCLPRAVASELTSCDDPAPTPGEFSGFKERGYYITFMRGTTFSFAAWKDIFDSVHADGGNLILLWMGGAFPSRKFPITWKYNAEHQNVQHDFAGKLIDYAHTLGIRVLLCLTPFGYDGVNQYALEHPELKAITKDGHFTPAFGLGAWGFNLNPYKAEAQRFMLEYTRELLDLYPNADGLMLESSDYAISYCDGCAETYYQKEFQFVREISEDLWARKPDAQIVVYPHYFSGSTVPGLDVQAAKEKFDPRWTLFFTPHSTLLAPQLMSQARSILYWDTSPTFGNPKKTQAAAQKALAIGATGFVPSFEPWTYVLQGPDGGDQYLVGQRLSPFGFEWLAKGASPTHELLMRINRLAYREFSRNPGLSFADFRLVLSEELFGGKANTELLDDLLFVEECFFLDRTWVSVCAIASPEYVKAMLDLGRVSPKQLEDYRDRRLRLTQIVGRYQASSEPTIQELLRTAGWVVTQWNRSPVHKFVDAHTS